MSYLDEGSGDPVVMLHGNPTWSFYYRNLVLALRDELSAASSPITSAAGSPTSRRLDQYDYSLKSRIDDLEALLDHLGVTREHHARPARLGRHDRHGLRRPASRTHQAHHRVEHRLRSAAEPKAIPLVRCGSAGTRNSAHG